MKSSFGTVDGRNVALPGMYKPCNTLPETNIAPENAWLDDEFPFGFRPIFRGRTVSFREGNIVIMGETWDNLCIVSSRQ